MQGFKIRCPSCTRISLETTNQFNPDLPPHGGMVKCLLQYHIDWLCTPTTKAAEMCCPECLAPLVVGGVLNVVMPAREVGEFLNVEIMTPELAQKTMPLNSFTSDGNRIRIPLDAGFSAEADKMDTVEFPKTVNRVGEATVLNEDQKNILQEGEIKKEQLRTSPPDMELPDGARMIDEPVPTPNEPITTPFTSDGNTAPAEALIEKVNDITKKAIDVLNAPNPLVCDVCGKECKSELGLNSHKKSHKGAKR